MDHSGLEGLLDVFEHAAMPIGLVDAGGVFLRVNPALAALLGRAEADLAGRPEREFVHPDDRPDDRPAMDRAAVGPREQRYLRPDGSVVWAARYDIALDDAAGHAAAMVLAVDITRLKQAQADLAGERLFLETLLENIEAPIFYKDMADRFMGCNKQFARLLERPKEEIIGHLGPEIVRPEDARRFKEADDALLAAGGGRRYETEVMAPDGTLHTAVLSMAVIPGPDGEPRGVVGVVHDITDLRVAEAALRRRDGELKARVARLDCLYGVSRLNERPGIGMGELLQGIADLLPAAWPAATGLGCRIVLEDGEFIAGTLPGHCLVKSDILVRGVVAGTVELMGPLPKEDGDVLAGKEDDESFMAAVAEQLGRIVERRWSEDRLRRRVQLETLISESAMGLMALEHEAVELAVSDVLERIGRFFGFDCCCLVTTGPDGRIQCLADEWRVQGLASLDGSAREPFPGDHDWWVARLRAGTPIQVPDVDRLPPEAEAVRAGFRAGGVRSALAVPVAVEGRLAGYLGLESQAGAYHVKGEDLPMLETLAGILVGGLERARAVAERDWNLRVKAALSRLYRPIISPFSTLETISKTILEMARDLTGSPDGFVGSIDKSSGDLVCHALTAMMGKECRLSGNDRVNVFHRNEDGAYPGLWGHALTTRGSFLTNSPADHPARGGVPEGHLSIARFMAVPVMLGQELLGSIALANKPADYTGQDLEAVAQMAEFYALALERLRFREQLEEVETRFLKVVETMNDGLLIFDEQGFISYANQRLANMLGRSLPDVIGHRVEDFTTPGDWARLEAVAGSGRQRESMSMDMEWRAADGSGVFTILSRSPIVDENGQYRGAFGIVHDMTQRKVMEAQLLQAQKLESIGQLAAGVAHEINTPAQYVGNNIRFMQKAVQDFLAGHRALEALLDRCLGSLGDGDMAHEAAVLREENDFAYLADELPAAIQESLDGIERISEIVRSVKQFAHPGKREMALTDLNDAIQSTVLVSTNEWKYVAEMVLDLDPSLPLVRCVASEIKQVVLNLIVNAAQAVAEKLGDKPLDKGRITVSTRPAKDRVEISIRDTGPGIPAAIRSRIFDPFFTTKEVGKGTGQGLSIAHAIVTDRHGGTIVFETEEGEGSVFLISLPLAAADTQAAAQTLGARNERPEDPHR